MINMHFVLELEFESNLKKSFSQIADKLKQLGISNEIEIKPYLSSCLIYFRNLSEIQQQKLDNVYEETLKLLETLSNNLVYSSSYLELNLNVNNLKNIRPIEYNGVIKFVLHSENTSLSGINKFIKKCKELYVHNCENISSSILGLLLIKARNVELYSNDYRSTHKWMDIVTKKYLDKHNDDVLECQEELIENGFKELAKL